MKRREFVGQAGCGLAAFLAASGLPAAGQTASQADNTDKPDKAVVLPPLKFYKIDIEIFEARPDTWCHKKGDKFAYPADWGKLCPWLRASLDTFIIALGAGGTLPWRYEGTPYEKVIDPDGITTEYIRCPDPTSNLVAKIIRTRIERPAE